MRRAVTRAAHLAPAVLAIMLVPGGASAAESAQAKAPASDQKKDAQAKPETIPTTVQPGESGLVVVRDAATGELRAPEGGEAAELLRQAVPANNMSDEGLVQVPLAKGGVMLDLKGRYMHYSVVTVQPDGSLRSSCVDHANHAATELAAPAAASAPAKEDR